MPRAPRSARRCGPATRPTSAPSCRSSIACAAASPSAGSAWWPTAACSRPRPSPPWRIAGWSMSSAPVSAPTPWSGGWCWRAAAPSPPPASPAPAARRPRPGGRGGPLDRQPRRGERALMGNPASRRYLRRTGKGQAFEIDPGKLADEARYDGVFVLRTNARISPLQAVLRYRDLLQVEDLFRAAKALMRTRPIYHSSDAAIRGHVFCSFLALVLRKEPDARCRKAGFRPEWGDVLLDLDRLQEIEITKGGQQITLRTPATGTAGALFKAAGIALPPSIRDAAAG